MGSITTEAFPDWGGIGDQTIKCSKCKFNFVLPMVSMVGRGDGGTNRGIKKLWDSTLSRKKQNVHIVAFMFPKTKICKKCYKVYEMKNDNETLCFEYKYWESFNEDQLTQSMFNQISKNTMKKGFDEIIKCDCGGRVMEFKKCPICLSELLFSNIEFDGVPVVLQNKVLKHQI